MYYKIGIFFTSCKSLKNPEPFDEQLQLLVCDALDASKLVQLEQVITLCGDVIQKTISWDAFPSYFLIHIIENWSKSNSEDFRDFFMNVDLSSSAIRNQIIVTSFAFLIKKII